MAIRAVVFDIGGVLEFTPKTGWIERWETRLGLDPGMLDEKIGAVRRAGSLGQMPEAEVEKHFQAILRLDQAQFVAFLADFWEEYVGSLNVAVADYFAGLRPRYQTAIISNGFVGATQREEELYHFGGMCDLVIYSHEVGCRKPDRRIFELTCERLGIQPAEMVFLDDVPGHVIAARELGIQAILFKDSAQALAEVQACLEAVKV
jgi:epoxide hydrolase-like predicted phosphatase